MVIFQSPSLFFSPLISLGNFIDLLKELALGFIDFSLFFFLFFYFIDLKFLPLFFLQLTFGFICSFSSFLWWKLRSLI